MNATKYTTRADYLGGAVTHSQHYGQLVEMLGESSLRMMLPKGADTPESARRVFSEGDKHYNSIPLAHWDARGYGVRELAHSAYRRDPETFTRVVNNFPAGVIVFSWSLSDSVCVLKECARRLAGLTDGIGGGA